MSIKYEPSLAPLHISATAVPVAAEEDVAGGAHALEERAPVHVAGLGQHRRLQEPHHLFRRNERGNERGTPEELAGPLVSLTPTGRQPSLESSGYEPLHPSNEQERALDDC